MNGISAVILAGGTSRRMGERNKLRLPYRGKTVLEAVAGNVLAVPFSEVIVVLGYQAEAVGKLLQPYPLRMAINREYRDGMATSLRTGISAAREDTAGYLICLGDMPLITTAILNTLCNAFSAARQPAIVVPTFQGKQRNPVIFSANFREELLRLEGDSGARSVIVRHPRAVAEVPFPDGRIFRDVDHREDYLDLEA